jgi:sugar phosphate permease
MQQKPTNRLLILFTLIIAGEAIFFLPFVLPRIFRPTFLLVFDITNSELGSYFSVYGIVAMISYLFGGPLADRFSARVLMSSALVLTSLGGVFLSFIPSGIFMKLIYGFWGLTTILLFWAALIRATREWGGTSLQGRAFGLLEGGRGLTAALMGTIALLVFVNQSVDMGAEVSEERLQAFRVVILVASLITFTSALLVWVYVPKDSILLDKEEFKVSRLLEVIKLKRVWLLAIIIVCAYVAYKITDDFSLYAKEVLGFSEVKATLVGTGALFMRAIVAFFAGIVSVNYKSVRLIAGGFAVSAISGGLLVLGLFEELQLLALANLGMLMIGIYSIRALYFALVQEAHVQLALTGTAVGFISVIGFTPDVFMSPWMGYLLDKYPGATGHRYVFFVLVVFAIAGFLSSLMFFVHEKRHK